MGRKMESMSIRNERKKLKRTQWTDTAEQILLKMWEDKILQLRRNRKNQHVYAGMSAELRKNGFSVSPLEVKTKVHNLTKRYRKEKLLVGPAAESSSNWPLYSRLYRFLGSYKYFNLSDNTCDSIPAPSTLSTEAVEAASFPSKSVLDCNYSSNRIPSEGSENDNFYEDIKDIEDWADHQDDVFNENEVIYVHQTEAPKNLKPKCQAIHKEEIQIPTSNERNETPLLNEEQYLISINRNLEILIELQKRSQLMERDRTAMLKEMLTIMKPSSTTEELTVNNEAKPRKQIKLNQTHDKDKEEYQQKIGHFLLNNEDPLHIGNPCEKEKHENLLGLVNEADANPPTSTIRSDNDIKSLDIKIKEEFLKAKELERQIMLDKHNLQMDILKVELQAKKKLNGL